MSHYDPAIAPEPREWLELDEQSRIALAEDYHNSANIKLPNVNLHSAFHVIVENQLAEGLQSTVTAVARLMAEGVSRHDAIHAIGSVLAEQIHQAAKSKDPNYGDGAQAWFDAKVAQLKAEDWKETAPN
jgi:uncharacterized protein YoaH (UPF0181 family)